jgi:hypothetical protein
MDHIEYASLALDVLKPFPGNAKKHNLDEQRRSLRKGQFQPIIVRRTEDGENIILAGHGTAEAAKLEDWKHIDAKVITCTDDEALWVNLAANKIGADEGYEQDLLAALLEELDGDYVGTGWSADDLDDLLAALDQVAETPYTATRAEYAETPEETEERAGLGSGIPLAARGIRETVIILPQEDHEELHQHLTKLRDTLDGTDLTNGAIILRAVRYFREGQ